MPLVERTFELMPRDCARESDEFNDRKDLYSNYLSFLEVWVRSATRCVGRSPGYTFSNCNGWGSSPLVCLTYVNGGVAVCGQRFNHERLRPVDATICRQCTPTLCRNP